jgi:bacterioferritin
MDSKTTKAALIVLNKLLENEYAGVIRYSHYSLMIYGYNRIPIVKWFREQSAESLTHAEAIGEHITTLGGHPSLKISNLIESHKHSMHEILSESLQHEKNQLKDLYKLLDVVKDKNILLEEFAREMIIDEETHVSEVEKMMRNTK